MKIKESWRGSRIVTVQLNLPCQFLMLCEILDVDPEVVIHDFIHTLGAENSGFGRMEQEMLKEYFIAAGYGQNLYRVSEIRHMFYELSCISSLWPAQSGARFIALHTHWRKFYHKHWFKKWLNKIMHPKKRATSL